MNISASVVSNNGVVTLYHDGEIFTVSPNNPSYTKVVELLKDGKLSEVSGVLIKPEEDLRVYTQGKVTVQNGEVTYNGHNVRNTLIERILSDMNNKKPFKRYVSFLEKLMENPSARSVNQLYDFLKYTCLRIADDGYFYAYKGISSDWKDKYTGKIDNSIGKTVTEERNRISDDPEEACHFGLHCGTIKYAREYSGDKLVIVRVHPKDVVSVPKDCTYQKCRVCEYTVMAECDENGNPVGDWKFSTVGADDVVENMHEGYGFRNATSDELMGEGSAHKPVEPLKVYDETPSVPYEPDDCDEYEDDEDENDDDAESYEDEDEEFCDNCGAYLVDNGYCSDCDEEDEIFCDDCGEDEEDCTCDEDDEYEVEDEEEEEATPEPEPEPPVVKKKWWQRW